MILAKLSRIRKALWQLQGERRKLRRMTYANVTVSPLILGIQGRRSARSSDLHDRQVGGDAATMSSPQRREMVFELVFFVHRV